MKKLIDDERDEVYCDTKEVTVELTYVIKVEIPSFITDEDKQYEYGFDEAERMVNNAEVRPIDWRYL